MMLRRISEVPGLDRVAARAQLLVLPVARLHVPVRVQELRFRAEQLERELRHALVRLGPPELRAGALGAGDAGLHQRRQRAVVGVAHGLQPDPLAGDRVALHLGRARLLRERDQLADLALEPGDERKAERAALVQQRRHRHLPARADIAHRVLHGHLDVGEEDLVELRLAGDLAKRPDVDARRVHVDEQIGQAGVALAVRVAAGDEDAPVGDVRERRPDLLAVDDEVTVLPAGARAHRGQVGARTRLGEALAPDLLGGEDLLEVLLLLGVGAVRDDRRPGHPEADHAEVRGCFGARHLLEEDRLVAVRGGRAAVLLGPRQPGVAGLVQLAAPVAAGLLEAAAPHFVREVGLDPRAQLGAERGLLRRVAEIHSPDSKPLSARRGAS